MKSRVVLVLVLVAALAGGWFFWQKKNGGATPSDGRLGKAAYDHTAAILARGPRPPASDGLKAVRGYVADELKKSGWVTQEQTFTRKTPEGDVTFVNLRARYSKTGGDVWAAVPAGILCAHIDSKKIPGVDFLGADDAASACAAIVELGHHLADKKPEQAGQLELVFFDGEEAFGESITTFDGLYGSREYAGLWRNKPQKPRFGILLDMVGHKNLSIRLPGDSPEFLRDHVLASAKEENGAKHFGMSEYAGITDDHVPLNLVGIPTIDLIGDFGNTDWWHNHKGGKDDLSIISAESLDLSMRVTLRTLDRLFGKDAETK